MKPKTVASVVVTLGIAAAFGSAPASAQSHPEYITGLAHGIKAVLYRPDSNPNSHTAVLVIHRTSNYLAHAACTAALPARLDGVLHELALRQQRSAGELGADRPGRRDRGRLPQEHAAHEQGRSVRPQRRRTHHVLLSSRCREWPDLLPGSQQADRSAPAAVPAASPGSFRRTESYSPTPMPETASMRCRA